MAETDWSHYQCRPHCLFNNLLHMSSKIKGGCHPNAHLQRPQLLDASLSTPQVLSPIARRNHHAAKCGHACNNQRPNPNLFTDNGSRYVARQSGRPSNAGLQTINNRIAQHGVFSLQQNPQLAGQRPVKTLQSSTPPHSLGNQISAQVADVLHDLNDRKHSLECYTLLQLPKNNAINFAYCTHIVGIPISDLFHNIFRKFKFSTSKILPTTYSISPY